MDKATKNGISHRGRSLALVLEHFIAQREQIAGEVAAAPGGALQ
jgi:hypothetical protein